jgi:hypothetical protein
MHSGGFIQPPHLFLEVDQVVQGTTDFSIAP